MWIKICCIQTISELQAAAAAGATHVGLVGEMPSGPGPLGDSLIRRIVAAAPDDMTTVLLTSRTKSAGIVEHVEATGVRMVQIVSPVDASVREAVRGALPGVRVVQVVHVEGPESVEVAVAAERGSDALLLDSGRPTAPNPELGGTGRTHDWSVSARIVERVHVPVLLAGGLHRGNVRDAVRAVRPAGVDVCSGLRDREGRLERASLQAFVLGVRRAHLG